jgi:maltooligosyltrehalose trehalohydrolase
MSESVTRAPRSSETPRISSRRLPIGAEPVPPSGGDRRVHFRVWAPAAGSVDVVIAGRGDHGSFSASLAAESNGYFSGLVNAAAGDRYRFRLDAGDRLYPDPASRFQPDGPSGPSEIVDPDFAWTDSGWQGVSRHGQVIYELHVGTFTREGTWEAAARELAELHDLGVTVVELMPVADFEGRFGWGYDGVDLFAPTHLYGSPDDLRRFVDRAHAVGIGVILDVVYNHLGPVGNYLRPFSPSYFTDRYDNEWGDAINFDGDDAGPVREFFIANAGYWIDEFHLDGLRLDATQQIFDASARNVMLEIGLEVRRRANGRSTLIVAENEPQVTRLVRPEGEGGFGLDALWNDDFHHSAMVALTGRAEAYYSDTYGEPQEFISAAKYGHLYQGQHYDWQRNARGTPGLALEPVNFVTYLQNHDQVANSGRGLRGHQLTSPARWRAMTALLLLMPSTPMLFQGQEFCSSSPFLYFADFEEELAAAVRKGRAEFLTQFPSLRAFEATATLNDPGSPETFSRCKLDFSERVSHADAYALHRDLLRVRRDTAAFRAPRRGGVDGAVLAAGAFALRFFSLEEGDRLLIVNLGRDVDRPSFAEPLLAPPENCEWRVQWASEDPRYGGLGMPDLFPDRRWHLPAESAVILAPADKGPDTRLKIRRRTA